MNTSEKTKDGRKKGNTKRAMIRRKIKLRLVKMTIGEEVLIKKNEVKRE